MIIIKKMEFKVKILNKRALFKIFQLLIIKRILISKVEIYFLKFQKIVLIIVINVFQIKNKNNVFSLNLNNKIKFNNNNNNKYNNNNNKYNMKNKINRIIMI